MTPLETMIVMVTLNGTVMTVMLVSMVTAGMEYAVLIPRFRG